MSRHTQIELLFSECIRSLPIMKRELDYPGLGFADTDMSDIGGVEDPKLLDPSAPALPIAAVDASSNMIGYSGGYVYELLRAGIVIRKGNGRMRLIKLGPFIIRSSSDGASFLFELETLAQRIAARRIKNGIVLFDGTTIQSADSERSFPSFEGLNDFISLSKVVPVSCAGNNEELPKNPFVAKLKNEDWYLVRLSTNGFILRARASAKNIDSTAWLFSCLSRSDSIEIGYPRTMKLAHMYSKILSMDVMSARLALFEKHNIKARDPIDGRKLLLGCLWG